MRAVAPPADFAGDPKGAAPIALHPAMRRTLLDLRCVVEGERAIGYWIGQWIDIAARHPDESERRKAEGFASLLTPVAKAFFTANGFTGASNALQVFGGYGYIHEYGIEQTVRDSRVSMLYEGTNEIQAIDMVLRKVVADGGERLRALLEHLRAETGEFANVGLALRRVGQELEQLCIDTGKVTATIIQESANDTELPYRVADDYLEMIGWLLLAYAWARTLRLVAHASGDDPFYANKCVTGHYFFDYKVAEFAHRKRLVEAGCRTDLPFLNPASVAP